MSEPEAVFASLGIPLAILEGYRSVGFDKLFEWQLECLQQTQVLGPERTNLLYTATTGSGKSLIAELVLLKTVICFKKKAIFVLPYVSLVMEKEAHMKRIVKAYNNSCTLSADRVKVV